jgi:site-specific recombinase XerD
MILDKYRGKQPDNRLLPVINNQNTNAYLKEIGTLCGIKKNLTFHLSRHTFATLTLSKGVSIESVSKMLGHTNIQTTQIYARITNEKIGNDMALFAGKVKGMEMNFTVSNINN